MAQPKLKFSTVQHRRFLGGFFPLQIFVVVVGKTRTKVSLLHPPPFKVHNGASLGQKSLFVILFILLFDDKTFSRILCFIKVSAHHILEIIKISDYFVIKITDYLVINITRLFWPNSQTKKCLCQNIHLLDGILYHLQQVLKTF